MSLVMGRRDVAWALPLSLESIGSVHSPGPHPGPRTDPGSWSTAAPGPLLNPQLTTRGDACEETKTPGLLVHPLNC